MAKPEDSSSLSRARLHAFEAADLFEGSLTADRDQLLTLAEKSAGIGIWDIDLTTGRARATPQFFHILGLEPTPDPVPIEKFRALRHPADRDHILEGFRQALASGQDNYEIEYRIVRPDGQVRWVFGRGRVVRDRTGKPVRYSGIDLDITERKAAEAALAESEARLSLAQEAAGIGIWDWDLATHALKWSPQQYVLHGMSQGAQPPTLEVWVGALHPQDRARARETVERALSGSETYEDEYRVLLDNGSIRWIVARAKILRDQAEAPARMIGVCYDDTERRTAIENLAQVNAGLEQRINERTAELVELHKFEALGQLTGGIAHDFNNLLSIILGNLTLLRKRLGEDKKAQHLVDVAIRGAERGASSVKRLLAFARRQELKSEPVDLPQLVRGMSDILERSMGSLIEIDCQFEEDLPYARCDANQLELAILNLAVNARDAMSRGGSMKILVTTRSSAEGGAATLAPGRYVVISVEDTGAGMDSATLTRAAEPFFTTKGPGTGTGLGLAMVHGFAVQSGGALRLISTIGEGTVAEIWLPVTGDAPLSAVESTPQPIDVRPGAVQRPLKILIVDDDVLVLMGTAAMLEDMGHSVIESLSAKEALERLRSTKRIDLVITDHAMPAMTGTQLAEQIKAEWPEMPVLLATGYAEIPAQAAIGLPRLNKPFDSVSLAAAISRLSIPTARKFT